MQINESDLTFHFGTRWMIRKYDEHRFYSRLSGAGLKAVDIISIYKKRQLILWEVKNFKDRKPNLRHDPLQEITEAPDQFIQEMAAKVKDTLRALKAINGFYKRRWLFFLQKLLLPIVYLPSFDWYFWQMAYQLSAVERQPRFILWLEGFQFTPHQEAKLKKALEAHLDDLEILSLETWDNIPDFRVASTL